MATPPSPPAAPNRLTDTDTQFVTKADAMMDWFADDMAAEFTTFGGEVVTEAADWHRANSTTSVAVGTGSKSFTIEANKAFRAGVWVTAHDAADPTVNYMIGKVTSYNTGTGALVISVPANGFYGSGTKTDWDIYIAGVPAPAPDALPSLSGNAGKVLAVNSGASATEWVDDGWVSLGSFTGSAVQYSTVTGIPQTYRELIVVGSFLWSGSAQISFDDGSTWALYTVTGPSSATTYYGSIHIPGYTFDAGASRISYNSGASPNAGGAGGVVTHGWRVTGGIDGIRFGSSNGGGTVTVTATLYGRR